MTKSTNGFHEIVGRKIYTVSVQASGAVHVKHVKSQNRITASVPRSIARMLQKSNRKSDKVGKLVVLSESLQCRGLILKQTGSV